MRVIGLAVATAASVVGAASAAAQDRQPCAIGYVCASSPASVMKAMEKAELAPRLTADNVGDPMIESDVAPFHYDIYFYGCELHAHCDSLRFEVVFSAGPENTVELANAWNASKRFVAAAVKPDGRFVLSYDVGTIGGMNPRNFADVLDWWGSMLGEFSDFLQARLATEGGIEAGAVPTDAPRRPIAARGSAH